MNGDRVVIGVTAAMHAADLVPARKKDFYIPTGLPRTKEGAVFLFPGLAEAHGL